MLRDIIGITRNDQARLTFCVTWSEWSRISQETRSLFNLEDDNGETVFCRSDSLPSRTRCDAYDVKKLATQLRGSDVSRFHMKSAKEGEDTYSVTMDKPLVVLTTKDTLPSEVVSHLLTAEKRGGSHHQYERTTSGGNHMVVWYSKEASLKDFCWPVEW